MGAIEESPLWRHQLLCRDSFGPQGIPSRLGLATALDFGLQRVGQFWHPRIFGRRRRDPRRYPSGSLAGKKIERELNHVIQQKPTGLCVVVVVAILQGRLVAREVRGGGKIFLVNVSDSGGGLGPKFLRRPLPVEAVALSVSVGKQALA